LFSLIIEFNFSNCDYTFDFTTVACLLCHSLTPNGPAVWHSGGIPHHASHVANTGRNCNEGHAQTVPESGANSQTKTA